MPVPGIDPLPFSINVHTFFLCPSFPPSLPPSAILSPTIFSFLYPHSLPPSITPPLPSLHSPLSRSLHPSTAPSIPPLLLPPDANTPLHHTFMLNTLSSFMRQQLHENTTTISLSCSELVKHVHNATCKRMSIQAHQIHLTFDSCVFGLCGLINLQSAYWFFREVAIMQCACQASK